MCTATPKVKPVLVLVGIQSCGTSSLHRESTGIPLVHREPLLVETSKPSTNYLGASCCPGVWGPPPFNIYVAFYLCG